MHAKTLCLECIHTMYVNTHNCYKNVNNCSQKRIKMHRKEELQFLLAFVTGTYMCIEKQSRFIYGELLESDFNCGLQLFQFYCHDGEPLVVKGILELTGVSRSKFEQLVECTLCHKIQLPRLEK